MNNIPETSLTVQQFRALLPRGSAVRIAKRTGRAHGHVAAVLRGERPDRKVAVAAARLLRRRLSDLPAELYEARRPATAA